MAPVKSQVLVFKKARGRPRKHPIVNTRTPTAVNKPSVASITSSRRRGRPAKAQPKVESITPDLTSSSGLPLVSDGSFWIPRRLNGQPPPFNDWAKKAFDKTRNKLYVYGGHHHDSENPKTLSEFHCCDLANDKTWIDLTVRPSLS
jgi:hypothetical protein